MTLVAGLRPRLTGLRRSSASRKPPGCPCSINLFALSTLSFVDISLISSSFVCNRVKLLLTRLHNHQHCHHDVIYMWLHQACSSLNKPCYRQVREQMYIINPWGWMQRCTNQLLEVSGVSKPKNRFSEESQGVLTCTVFSPHTCTIQVSR